MTGTSTTSSGGEGSPRSLVPEVADTIAERPAAAGAPDIEYARVKNLVRGGLFGRDAVPVRIGRFTVLRHLGAGGMSVVYSAYDDELDRKVAIKLLRPDPSHPAAAIRLRREAQAIARLSHPNVIPVYEVGEHRGELFIAMEFVRGRTLRAWMEERARPWDEICDVMMQAAEGLNAAHRAGVVHRDFKPENVMLGEDGRVRVLDFGVAALAVGLDAHVAATGAADTLTDTSTDTSGDGDARLTRDGTILGTPAYMSPEALAGERVDARTDQFSFCLTCWEALTGQRPFGATSIRARQEAIIAGPDNSADAPGRIRDALRRGMRAGADDRWPDMRNLIAALAPPRRSAGWGIAAVVATIAAGAGAVALSAQSPSDACDTAEKDLAEIWGPRVNRDATAALAAAEGSVALDVWTATQARLDGYAEDWLRARATSCSQDPREGERALQRELCFAWTLQDLDALVAPLVGGDTAAVAAAEDKLEALTPPQTCRNPAEVSRRMEERARRAAPAPAGSGEGILSDFESAQWTRYGAGWASSTDQVVGGASRSEMRLTEGGANGSQHALRVSGDVAVPDEGQPAWSGAMVFLGETPFAPANLTSKKRLTLWARGTPGPHAVMLFTATAGFRPAVAPFSLTEDWQKHVFELDALESERFDVTAAFVGAVMPGPFAVEIDDLTFE